MKRRFRTILVLTSTYIQISVKACRGPLMTYDRLQQKGCKLIFKIRGDGMSKKNLKTE